MPAVRRALYRGEDVLPAYISPSDFAESLSVNSVEDRERKKLEENVRGSAYFFQSLLHSTNYFELTQQIKPGNEAKVKLAIMDLLAARLSLRVFCAKISEYITTANGSTPTVLPNFFNELLPELQRRWTTGKFPIDGLEFTFDAGDVTEAISASLPSSTSAEAQDKSHGDELPKIREVPGVQDDASAAHDEVPDVTGEVPKEDVEDQAEVPDVPGSSSSEIADSLGAATLSLIERLLQRSSRSNRKHVETLMINQDEIGQTYSSILNWCIKEEDYLLVTEIEMDDSYIREEFQFFNFKHFCHNDLPKFRRLTRFTLNSQTFPWAQKNRQPQLQRLVDSYAATVNYSFTVNFLPRLHRREIRFHIPDGLLILEIEWGLDIYTDKPTGGWIDFSQRPCKITTISFYIEPNKSEQ